MLKTKWYELAEREIPLPEYPRPQMVRDTWMNLNGWYEYAITGPEAEYMGDSQGQIRVPYPIESELSGVKRALKPNERLWYRRKFSLNNEFHGKRVLLHFGAVDWQCKVWINGELVGHHTGGYTPFYFDITDYLRSNGNNHLVVCVYDPTDSSWQQRGKQVSEPKGVWYTSVSGIWQTVWLEGVSNNYIKNFKITPDIDKNSINIKADVEAYSDYYIKVQVFDGDNEVASKVMGIESDVELGSCKLWSPEDPFLYDIKLTLFWNDRVYDEVKGYFGMRKFSIGKADDGFNRLFLNNKPYFQKGVLDQGYYCEGLYTPSADEQMINDIELVKAFGFNMIRKHMKVESQRWYYHCDKIGLIVWQDMMSGGQYIGDVTAGVLPIFKIRLHDNRYDRFSRSSKRSRDNFKSELFDVISHLYNCTCIGCWSIFNEGWGQFDAKEIAESVKKYDTTRFVDHASGWYDQDGPDLNSMHRYILSVSLPKNMDKRPFVVSEFGGYGLVCNDHIWKQEQRRHFGYKMYSNSESLTRGYIRLIENQILPLIPKGLSATVYTQLNDVEFEVNGLMSYDRKVIKLDIEKCNLINQKLTY